MTPIQPILIFEARLTEVARNAALKGAKLPSANGMA